jgi:hypothetical protein
MSVSEPASRDAVPSGTVAGGILVLCSLVAIVSVAHHPSVGHARSRADVLAQIIALQGPDHTVHAIVLAAAAGMLFGLVVFAQRLGLQRQTVSAGLVAYALGTATVLFAGLLDGFAIPSVAVAYAGRPDGAAGALQLITLCAILIQVCTKFWLFATSAAVGLWSFPLLRAHGMLRAIGVLGIAASVLIIAGTAMSATVNAHTLGALMLLQAIWTIAIGVLMIRGDL